MKPDLILKTLVGALSSVNFNALFAAAFALAVITAVGILA